MSSNDSRTTVARMMRHTLAAGRVQRAELCRLAEASAAVQDHLLSALEAAYEELERAWGIRTETGEATGLCGDEPSEADAREAVHLYSEPPADEEDPEDTRADVLEATVVEPPAVVEDPEDEPSEADVHEATPVESAPVPEEDAHEAVQRVETYEEIHANIARADARRAEAMAEQAVEVVDQVADRVEERGEASREPAAEPVDGGRASSRLDALRPAVGTVVAVEDLPPLPEGVWPPRRAVASAPVASTVDPDPALRRVVIKYTPAEEQHMYACAELLLRWADAYPAPDQADPRHGGSKVLDQEHLRMVSDLMCAYPSEAAVADPEALVDRLRRGLAEGRADFILPLFMPAKRADFVQEWVRKRWVPITMPEGTEAPSAETTPEPAAVVEPATESGPAPTSAPAQAPAPAPMPEPESEQAPEPALEQAPEQAPAPAPAPEQAPAPGSPSSTSTPVEDTPGAAVDAAWDQVETGIPADDDGLGFLDGGPADPRPIEETPFEPTAFPQAREVAKLGPGFLERFTNCARVMYKEAAQIDDELVRRTIAVELAVETMRQFTLIPADTPDSKRTDATSLIKRIVHKQLDDRIDDYLRSRG